MSTDRYRHYRYAALHARTSRSAASQQPTTKVNSFERDIGYFLGALLPGASLAARCRWDGGMSTVLEIRGLTISRLLHVGGVVRTGSERCPALMHDVAACTRVGLSSHERGPRPWSDHDLKSLRDCAAVAVFHGGYRQLA